MAPRRHHHRDDPVAHTPPSMYLDSEPVVLASARKHGVADEDILHAWHAATWATGQQDDGLVMLVGPDRTGRLLELGAVEARDLPGVPLLVHAMPARDKYLKNRDDHRCRR